jgi:AsmA protein
MTILKWLAGALMSLLLMLVLAIFLIPMLVDPNDYRQAITELVQEKTGRELRLDGDLKISVFPWLGIRTQQLSLAQPAEIGGQMVKVETAQLRLKLMPLLSKQLEIDTVILEQPTLRLITLENGISSFTGLAGAADSSGPVTPAASGSVQKPVISEGADTASGTDAAVALVVSGVEITDANVLWDDRQAGQKYEVNDFNLTTGNLLGADLADISLSGLVIDAADPTPINLKLDGKARIDADTFMVFMQDIDAQVGQGEQSFGVNFTQLRYDLQAGINLQGLGVNAELSIPVADAAPQTAQIALALNELNYALVGKVGDVEANALSINGRFVERDFTLNAPTLNANLEAQTATIPSLTLLSGDLDLALTNLAAKQFIDNPQGSGQILVKPFNALKLLRDLAIDYAPTGRTALTAVGLSMQFDGGVERISLKDIDVQLDQSRLRGNFAINDFANLAANFDLRLDQLNLDDYLPLGSEEDSTDQISGGEAMVLPLALLKGIDANGLFKADSLITGGLELSDIDVSVVSANGTLTVTPRAKLYDGSLVGDIAFTDAAEATMLKVKNEIDLVDLAKLLTAAEVSEQLSGIGSVNVDVAFTEKNGVQTNEGIIKLLAKNGAVKGIDIKKMLDTAYATYAKFTGSAPDDEAAEDETGDSVSSDETRFAELLGTFYLKDYVLRNDDFSLKAPLFRVAGNGTIDIAAQTLDYLVKVAVVGSTDGQGGKAISELAGITIPIRLRGDLTAPSYSLDMQSLYQSYAKREIEKKKGQFLQDKLGIEGGEKMSTKDVLKGALFKKLNKDADKRDAQSEPVPYEQTGTAQSEQPSPAQANDTPPDPVPYEETGEPEPERELTKKEKRDERKKKLLESIFK